MVALFYPTTEVIFRPEKLVTCRSCTPLAVLLIQEKFRLQVLQDFFLTLEGLTPQNSQIHSNNSSATSDELFECV